MYPAISSRESAFQLSYCLHYLFPEQSSSGKPDPRKLSAELDQLSTLLAPIVYFPVTEQIYRKAEWLRDFGLETPGETPVERFCEYLRGLPLLAVDLFRFLQETLDRLTREAMIEPILEFSDLTFTIRRSCRGSDVKHTAPRQGHCPSELIPTSCAPLVPLFNINSKHCGWPARSEMKATVSGEGS